MIYIYELIPFCYIFMLLVANSDTLTCNIDKKFD